jgi:translation initiation factor 1 (eIF-1/SUI1)
MLRKKIKNLVNNSKRQREYRNLRDISTVLLLFDTADQEDVRHVIAKLKKAGKAITTIAYHSSSSKPFDNNWVQFTVSENDIRAQGEETMKQITKMLAQQGFDTVIDLTTRPNLTMQYLLVLANAGLKTGLYTSRPPLHDMVVAFTTDDGSHPPFSVKSLGMSMLHYLSIIS